jgi:dTDP-4-dehydrorhamnose 3,5-epimerase
MEIQATEIPDVKVIEPRVFADSRGFFSETFSAQRYADAGVQGPFVQDNWSHSANGSLRGLHYQIEQAQGKLVQVINGSIFDVAVDLRKQSATFGKWIGIELSSENKRQLYIPPGFAHGFLVLSESADFLYKCTDYYAPEHERTLLWNDQSVAIDWPLEGDPILSEKDTKGLLLDQAEIFTNPI